MLKNYFKKKSVLAIIIDVIIVLAAILMLIPSTRKHVAPVIMKPTLFIHQPKVNADKPTLNSETYNWRLLNENGITFTFNDFKEKVVLINFWATWCPPCVAEMPDLHKLYADYGDKVEFLFVSNEDFTIMSNFLTKKGIAIPIYKPISQYPTDFETSSIPTTFVINKKGEIVISRKGIAQWNSKKIRNILDILVNE